MNKENIIWDILKEKHIFSLDDLKEKTDWNFSELFTTVSRLAADGKITLSVSINAEKHYTHLSRYEYLFTCFMDLVSTHLDKERSINFYASQMCISPKYLSTIVKQVSGKTPTEYIKEKMIDEIKYRLCCTQASIKEIAYGLNFSNLSFFGKYFKADTGYSPSSYRTKHSAKMNINNPNN